MAWIKKREDIKRGGRKWELGFGDASGKRVHEYFATLDEAEGRRTELDSQKRKGVKFSKSKAT